MINSIQRGCYLILLSLTLLNVLCCEWTFGIFSYLPTVLLLPVNVNLLLHSCCIIYIGSTLSFKLKNKTLKEGEEKEQEVMTSKDAAMFPLIGSCMLFGLYVLFKVFDKEWVNLLLTAYFAILGTYSLTAAFDPLVESLIFTTICKQAQVIKKSYRIPYVSETLDIDLTRSQAFTSIFAAIFAGTWFKTRHFILNNMFGIAFSIKGIEALALGSYKTGAILLAGLFFYDIFWVFGTDVMVTVATSFDAPVKLLFPRALATATEKAKFSMLGLGDIVIPGIFIAMLLRYDAHRAGVTTNTLAFPKPFFHANMIGYFLGLVATVVVMYFFNAAQPALLYLVPACLGVSSITALYYKDFWGMWNFSEEEEEEVITEIDDKKAATTGKKGTTKAAGKKGVKSTVAKKNE